ncbi:MAG: hemerythrin domain-containing protein [Gammaproteobacteria bacterium]|nr:hemerythrin domain-containing protein [Gammaproteobacteria bacterium]MBT7369539.1 hemerythrin domain-containing protein [Gammaproteobacteria bacterium]
MANSHASCDELLANAENLAVDQNWQKLTAVFESFVEETEKHFRNEEEILFPKTEGILPPGGPVEVMKYEHRQMRDLIGNLREQLGKQDQAGFLGEIETLVILMQQHNMKEEQILYPMLDQLLSEDVGTVIEEMDLT